MSELNVIVREELNSIIEKSPEGWEGTVKALKKHGDKVDNPWALAHWMKNKGWKSHKEGVREVYLTENPAAMAAAAMATVRLKNQQGRTIKGTSALKSKNPVVKKKAVGMFQRLKDKFAKKKDDKKAAPKKQSKSDADFYKRQYAGESINERSDFRAMKDFMALASKRKIDYISRYDDSQLQVDIGKKSFLIQVQSLEESINEVLTRGGAIEVQAQTKYMIQGLKEMTKSYKKKDWAQMEEYINYIVTKAKLMGDIVKQKRHQESVNEAKESSIDVAKRIVKNSQSEKVQGVLIDMQTANLILQVHKAVNPKNKKNMERMPMRKLASVVWKLAGK